MPKSRKTIEKSVAEAIEACDGLKKETKKLVQWIMDGGEHRTEALRTMKMCGYSDVMDQILGKKKG